MQRAMNTHFEWDNRNVSCTIPITIGGITPIELRVSLLRNEGITS